MKQAVIAIILAAQSPGQSTAVLDMGKLAETLRLTGTELTIENVTEREAAARNLPLKSAWIVSSPEHDLFFPLVIYTSAGGVLNDAKYDELRKKLREKPLKEGDFGYGLGSFDVPGVRDCFVFLEQFRISSIRPAGVEGVLAPWKPTNVPGLSVTGTVVDENLDFQIALILTDEDEIGNFPEYKGMLYGPDYPDVKNLASALVEVVRDSELLTVVQARPEKRPQRDGGTNSAEDAIDAVATNDASGTEVMPETNAVATALAVWPWLLGVFALLAVLVLVRKYKQ